LWPDHNAVPRHFALRCFFRKAWSARPWWVRDLFLTLSIRSRVPFLPFGLGSDELLQLENLFAGGLSVPASSHDVIEPLRTDAQQGRKFLLLHTMRLTPALHLLK
jgi:hypothetical protein